VDRTKKYYAYNGEAIKNRSLSQRLVCFFLLIGNSIAPAMTSGSGTVEFNLQNTLQCHTKPVNHLAVSQEYSRLISIGAVLVLLSISSHAFLTND
jgi:hypothetical protein